MDVEAAADAEADRKKVEVAVAAVAVVIPKTTWRVAKPEVAEMVKAVAADATKIAI